MQISRLFSGGIITNYRCTSKCKHCLYGCSQNWEKEYIKQEQLEENLKVIRKMKCHSIHIGGGEPFLDVDGLEMVLNEAYSQRIGIEYIETNSSWYKDEDSAMETLLRLRNAGLRQLLISISPFHNEYIPFKKVKGVMDACQRSGISVFPWVMDFYSDLEQFDENKTHKLEEYEKKFGSGYLRNVPSRYWIHFGGRSIATFKNLFSEKSLHEILQSAGPCRELSDTSHFHIDLFGNYIPGLCSGLSIQAPDLGKQLDQSNYPIISNLYNKGISALLELARQEFGFVPDANYVSKCHLCFKIRKFLIKDAGYLSHQLQPSAFYDNV